MEGGKEKLNPQNAEDTVNIDEIVTTEQDAPTEPLSDQNYKGVDANRYATKKTVAQGMLDIALLTSNASQLKYVLQVGQRHEFYTLLVALISISIVLQASAGLLAIIISFIDGEASQKHKKIADWLYHASVGMMTVVVFCDVMKMTFGLDPALSLSDYLGNNTSKLHNLFYKVLSALVAVVLSTVFNINFHPDCPKAEILNNVSFAFKIVGVALNVIISIFYSMDVDTLNVV